MAARLVLLIVVAIAAGARAETRPGYGGAVVATLASEPVALDPAAARSHAEVALAGLVFDTLYRVGADGAVAPHLAAGPPQPSGNTLRIAIRPGVRFHDGSTLDAADVAASLRRLARGDAGWLLAPVSAIEVDAGDLLLTVRGAADDVPALLAAPQAAITPDGAAPKARALVGSGPFRVDAIDRKRRRIRLVASDDHFAGRPYVDQVELRWYADRDAEARAYEDGELHLSARGATVFRGAQPKYQTDVVDGPATILTFVGFGKARPAITGDRDFRRAIHLALARGGLAATGRSGRVEPTADALPLDLGGAALDDDLRAGDASGAAKALARAAGRVDALAPRARDRLTLEILVDETRLDDREVAERVQRALDKLDLGATIVEVPAARFADRVARGDADLWIGQLAAPGASAAAIYAAAFAAGGDRWAEQQLAAGTFTAAKARAELAARLPIVPLLHRGLRVHHRADVRGVVLDAASRPPLADLFLFGAPARTRKGR